MTERIGLVGPSGPAPSIAGTWQKAISPATGAVIAEVAWADVADVEAAVAKARAAVPAWASLGPYGRAAALEAVADAVAARRGELEWWLTADQGKPLRTEAADEVSELLEYLKMAASDARGLSGEVAPSRVPGRLVLLERVPLGVVGVVSPWNWPYTMGAEVFAPALAAGNAVVWVPAPSTAACSVVLAGIVAQALADAGAPSGVFQCLPGDGPVVGDALVAHPGVDGVGFVGSEATGATVAARAAGKVQLLELGGNGPFVVLSDADVERAARAALEAAYLCAGQSCTAGERFIVDASVHDAFVEAVVELTRAEVRLGDPFDEATTMGPLNNEAVAAKVDHHVADARSGGASVLLGGRRAEALPTSLYYEATVVDHVTPGMVMAEEETFGPVVPVLEVSGDDEALQLANASRFGLLGAVFSDDLSRALRFARAMRTGWVNVNASTNVWESQLPFGGRSGSASGRGRVGGRWPLEAFSEPRTLLVERPLP